MHDVEPGHSRFDVGCMASAICLLRRIDEPPFARASAHPRIEQTMLAMLFIEPPPR
jgi:hypothetical protein